MTTKLAIDGGQPVRAGSPIPLWKVCFGQEEMLAVQEVFESGVFCAVSPGAQQVKALEAAFAEAVGAKHAVAFSSGANAQHTSLNALNIGPGDEVIVPSLSFFSTTYSVLLQNALPVFADVDLETITLDPDDVRRKITPRTKAIVPVHWFGRPAEMDGIRAVAAEHNLAVIEDCAQALGSAYKGQPAGSLGVMACWSLQESKLITAAGDGGLLTTNDDALAERARMGRDHGRARLPAAPGRIAYSRFEIIGNHYRLTEIQAAFALAQLRKAESFRERRQAHTEYLDSRLKGLDGLAFQQREGNLQLSYNYYPVRFLQGRFARDIDGITQALVAEGVTAWAIAKDETSHTQPVLTERRGRGAANCPFDCVYNPADDWPKRYGPGTLPNSERLAEEVLTLPLYPDLTQTDLDDIVRAVEKVSETLRV